MWQNSNELLEHALRELQVAVAQDQSTVEITLQESFLSNEQKIREFCAQLGIKEITEKLRQIYADYNVRSTVQCKNQLKLLITYAEGPCSFYYPLVWRLTLQKK